MAMSTFSALTLADHQPSSISSSSTPEDVLLNPVVLSATFQWLQDDIELIKCSVVCKTWRAVLESDEVWRAVYLRHLPPPEDFERVGSYRLQFQRLRGLLDLSPAKPTALKGSAVCYNAATGHLVSFNATQRMMSIQLPDGSIRSEVLDVDMTGNGSASRPLLASSSGTMVVLAAFDGILQLWDASSCQQCGVLGHHPSFITSLAASGDLSASTCSSELRVWKLSSRQCLFLVPVGLPIPSPVLEPHVALCHMQQLVAVANSAAPAPSSVVKVYSALPASSSSSSNSGSRGGSSCTATTHHLPAAGTVVGSSAVPGASGALLLRELPVNAAADMLLQQGLLLVASCFHGRSVSSNTPYKSERPFTVVVQIWDTLHWQLTRMVSPRLWTDYPIYTMEGTPKMALSQSMLLCATLRSGVTNHQPSCCIHAWQLNSRLLQAGQTAAAAAAAPSAAGTSCTTAKPSSGGGGSIRSSCSGADATGSLCLLSVSQQGNSSSSSSSSRGAIAFSTSSSGHSSGPGVNCQQQPQSFGEGAMALGRAAVAVTGGAGPVGVSSNNTVMLPVSDADRDEWMPLLDDTGGRLTVLITTPTQMVMATESGCVLRSSLLNSAAAAAVHQGLQHQHAIAAAGTSGTPREQQQGEFGCCIHVGL